MRVRSWFGLGSLVALAAAGSLQCGKAAVDDARAGGGGATTTAAGTGGGGATRTTTGTGGAGGGTTTDACAAACAAEKGCSWDLCAHFADEFFPDATFKCPKYECAAKCMLEFGPCKTGVCETRGAAAGIDPCLAACPNFRCDVSGGGSSSTSMCMRAIAAACGAPYAACRADAACSPYALCFADCSRSDVACMQACEEQLGDGSAKQRALLGCACEVMDSQCTGPDTPPIAACAAFADAGAGGHAN
jgi:hypothetical protein